MSEPRSQDEIQKLFQQNRYEAGWLDYRIKNSQKEQAKLDKECESLLAEAEMRAKLDAEAKAAQPIVEGNVVQEEPKKEVENGKSTEASL